MDCSRIARWYELLEHLCFGNALQKRRSAFLAALDEGQKAILAGEGNGCFLAGFLSANPNAKIDVVDVCQNMLKIAERRITNQGHNLDSRIALHCADIREFVPPTTSYDLIATHFFLDCFSTSEVHEIVSEITRWAAPNARWVVSEFHHPETMVGRLWSSVITRSLYFAFRITTDLEVNRLPDYRPALVSAGFEILSQEQSCGGLLVSELWQPKT